jgi:uncharacterized protein
MNKIILIFTIIAACAHGSALPDYPFVYVTGVATKEIAPDVADLDFGIETKNKDSEVAYSMQSSVAKKIIEFANSLGISGDDIIARPTQKSFLALINERLRASEGITEPKEPEYELSRTVTIHIKDLSVYAKLIELLYKQQYVVHIKSSFNRSDSVKIEESLIKDACSAALKKADALADGFSKKVKAVKAISEDGFSGMESTFGLPANSDRAYPSGLSSESADFRIIPLTIKFRRHIYAICEIQ